MKENKLYVVIFFLNDLDVTFHTVSHLDVYF